MAGRSLGLRQSNPHLRPMQLNLGCLWRSGASRNKEQRMRSQRTHILQAKARKARSSRSLEAASLIRLNSQDAAAIQVSRKRIEKLVNWIISEYFGELESSHKNSTFFCLQSVTANLGTSSGRLFFKASTLLKYFGFLTLMWKLCVRWRSWKERLVTNSIITNIN